MEAMRESWTDERLDDFRAETARRFEEARTETAQRFDRVEADIREIRGEMNAGFERVDARLDDFGKRLDDLNNAMLKMSQTMLWLGGGALITFIVGFGGLILTQL
jgi:hypothetical protein